LKYIYHNLTKGIDSWSNCYRLILDERVEEGELRVNDNGKKS